MAGGNPHVSVLLEEAVAALAPKAGRVYVDGTFGAGGHSRAILESCECTVVALDRDETVMPFVNALKDEFGERFHFIASRFSDMKGPVLARVGCVDGVLLDVGVSSMQLDNAERGFSFMKDGPLDMRMGASGMSAADFVNTQDEAVIADTLFHYGGEKKSRRIARAIVHQREEKPFETTLELAGCIKRTVGRYNDTIHPATRSFQAIRIAINEELEQLQEGLAAAADLLCPGGRLAVITFHSGEDAIVKRYFKEKTGKIAGVSRHMPATSNDNEPATFRTLTRKPIEPSAEEIADNARARSAKLRVVERLGEGN